MIALVKPDNQIVDTIIQGDALEVLRTLPDNCIDSVVTDPPYGLGEVKDITRLLMAWMNGEDGKEFNNKKGFMSKDWDVVPSPRVWKEVYRVLRPGGYLLAFAGTRTWDLMSISIRLAGFEDRDTINHSYGSQNVAWMYGSGFPKSTAIDKAIDAYLGKDKEREVVGEKRSGIGRHGRTDYEVFHGSTDEKLKHIPVTSPATEEAAKWQGWGNNLKPAWEPILMFRKPLDGTLAENVLKWGTGGLNIDACRVGTQAYTQEQWTQKGLSRVTGNSYGEHKGSDTPVPQGRFPSNLLLSHSLFCTPLGTHKVKGNGPSPLGKSRQTDDIYALGLAQDSPISYRGEDGMETIQAWDCTEDCPIRLLDEQSGIRPPGYRKNPSTHGNAFFGNGQAEHIAGERGYSDQGGASRYFTQFCYTAKASRSERNRGCEGLPEQDVTRVSGIGGPKVSRCPEHDASYTNDGGHYTCGCPYVYEGGSYNRLNASKNSHPTVKPLQLMRWLCRLITPPNGIVLDCFAGSGSTLCAAIYEGLHYIGIEAEQDYVNIARARIAHAYGEVAR